jgi:hypothetical protein
MSDNFNVNSYFQSGGITAGIVNVGRVPRQLTQANSGKMQQMIDHFPEAEFRVTAMLGDAESINFAHQILDFIRSLGRKAQGVNKAVPMKRVTGVVFTPPRDNVVEVTVGNQI